MESVARFLEAGQREVRPGRLGDGREQRQVGAGSSTEKNVWSEPVMGLVGGVILSPG